ncbi:hypothetical protein SAMN04515621_0219 [Erythrobacter sp. HL-111]|nr:MAG: hypothetical protein HLUCCO15_01695 [Erythrobacteraceae bacterium HL-111]SDR73295.1 hypothetical protein SAMN04515621_0219 [Erythrobacter sp. HL-111]
MRPERIMLAGHSLALGFALAVAAFCPRPGEPALLVPVAATGADGGLLAALAWARREGTRPLLLDTAGARMVAPVPSHGSLLRALAAGILPIAAGTAGCAEPLDGERQWKS